MQKFRFQPKNAGPTRGHPCSRRSSANLSPRFLAQKEKFCKFCNFGIAGSRLVGEYMAQWEGRVVLHYLPTYAPDANPVSGSGGACTRPSPATTTAPASTR